VWIDETAKEKRPVKPQKKHEGFIRNPSCQNLYLNSNRFSTHNRLLFNGLMAFH